MKLLLLPLLLLVGAGAYGLAGNTGSETPATCDDADCRIEVTCTDRGTCLVTCYDANGDVVCEREVPCDGPCEKACDKPCDAPCPPSQSCTR